MSQGSPYQYSAEDIRRYMEGRMPPAEMHAMEKAALDDPFLADAMEGYEQHSDLPLQEDLAELKQRLDQRIQPRISAQTGPKQWLSIAAATVVVLGTAVVLWLTAQQPSSVQIAKLEVPQRSVSDSVAAPVQTELAKADQTAAANKPDIKATAVDEKPRPALASAETIREDSAARASIALNEQVQAPKAAPTVDKLDRTKLNDEAVAVKSKSVAPTTLAAKTKKDTENTARIYAEPTDGWSAFEVYMHNNLRRPKEPSIQGNVIVSFAVNPENGKLFDIKIDKSLHPAYDKEAIRVLKEGPTWTVYNTEGPVRTTYTVVF